jgi:hypothetical protein
MKAKIQFTEEFSERIYGGYGGININGEGYYPDIKFIFSIIKIKDFIFIDLDKYSIYGRVLIVNTNNQDVPEFLIDISNVNGKLDSFLEDYGRFYLIEELEKINMVPEYDEYNYCRDNCDSDDF